MNKPIAQYMAWRSEPAKEKLSWGTLPSLQLVLVNGLLWRLPHVKTLLSRRLTCVYCCSQKHETAADSHNTRRGHKTIFECSTCKVPLCYGPRFDGESCAKLFHDLEEINDPCAIGTITSSIRAVKYRPPPPSRKQSGDDLPYLRSKLTEFTTPMIRQSARFS